MRLVAVLTLALALSGCGTVPEPDPAAPVPVQVASVEGPFELTLLLPRSVYGANEPITGEIRLAVLDGAARTIGGSGGGPLATSFAEFGGTRRMEAGWDSSCGSFEVLPAAPLRDSLSKSGGWSADDPNDAFYEAFFAAPDIRLPPGTWDVSARASFSEGDCGGPMHEMTTTARILVLP